MKITTHTLVKNEQRFIKPAILSVINHVDTMLVWDTGSTDKTVEQIQSIKSPKIHFKQMGPVNRQELVRLRNEQIKLTTTPWFMLLDGDEIWPEPNIIQLIKAIKTVKPTTIALVNRTRNCLGDIYHYQPESAGHYQIGSWQGNLNIRAIRKIPGLKVEGQYPLESYTHQGIPLQEQSDKLVLVDTWYLHLTHLQRSDWQHQLKVIDRLKKYKFWGKRLKLKPSEIPQTLR